MAGFITRVELHHASTSSDYDALHSAMQAAGFSRTIPANDGVQYHLPTAEYYCAGQYTLQQVLNAAKTAAAKTNKTYSLLVSQPDNAWTGFNLLPAK